MAALEIKGSHQFYCTFNLKEKEKGVKNIPDRLKKYLRNKKLKETAFTLTVQSSRFNDISMTFEPYKYVRRF